MAVLDWVLGLAIGAVVGGAIGWLVKAVLTGREVAQADEGRGALEARLEEQAKAAAREREVLATSHEKELDRLATTREEQEAAMEDRIRVLSSEIAIQQRDQFLEIAEQRMKREQEKANASLTARQKEFEQLVKPVTDKLEALEKSTAVIEKERQSMADTLKEQLERLGQRTDSLGRSADGLRTALRRSSTVRGQWGEVALARLLEMAGLTKGVDYEEQVTTEDRSRPDVVVRLPDGGVIPIDAKASGQHYLDAIEADDPDVRAGLLKQHAGTIWGRIRELQTKAYQESLPGHAQFAVMFVPSDAFIAAAYDVDPDLLQKGLDRNVLIASPVSLLALLRTVALAWRQVRFSEEAQEVVAASREFYKRMAVWSEHFVAVGKGLERANAAYDKAVSSWERRVLPQARVLDELRVSEDLPKQLQSPTEPSVRVRPPHIDSEA